MLKVPAGGEQANWRVAQALGRAAGRSVIAVTRDAHRDPGAQAVITRLLAVRPDTIVVEMGLPVWRPPARAYLATDGSSRTSGQAAARGRDARPDRTGAGLTAPEPPARAGAGLGPVGRRVPARPARAPLPVSAGRARAPWPA